MKIWGAHMNEKKIKIIFAASSGGHYEQLLMLKPLMQKYPSIIVTEKTTYQAQDKVISTYYLKQINRKEILFLPKLIFNFFKSLVIVIRERPNVMVTTGVLSIIPLAFIMKLKRGKLIYIESFAKTSSKTMSGNLLYRYADQFYVQWPDMQKLYPKAIYKGGIY